MRTNQKHKLLLLQQFESDKISFITEINIPVLENIILFTVYYFKIIYITALDGLFVSTNDFSPFVLLVILLCWITISHLSKATCNNTTFCYYLLEIF